MDYDTDIGGPSGAFPATHYAVILASGSSDSEARKQALEVIVAAYWKPIYKYIRLKGASNENAKDLTQAFFARALDKGFFQREWVRNLFSLAIEELRGQCAASKRSVTFALFERHDLEGPDAVRKPTYAQLAEEFGLTVSQVTNHLARARQRFRELVLEKIRATTGSDEEFRAEVQRLLGDSLS